MSSEDFYKINPRGAVPILMLDDGMLITQNLAVLTYLGGLDKQFRLLPKPGTMEYVRCLQWLGFANSDLHTAFKPLFSPHRFVDSEYAKDELKRHAENNIIELMTYTDKRLTEEGYALGEHFSVIDAYLLVFYRWAKHFKLPIVKWPNYAMLAQRISARPTVQRTLISEGLLK